MSVLYVVATPIGNLEDITLRALRVLREVHLIAAEDTRKTRRLLTAYHIKTPLTSYYEHNKLTKLDFILGTLQDHDVALVSEAGMPGISDPGYELVVAASEHDIRVVPVPGPSALTAALAASALPTDRFTFIGFLPSKAGARRKALEGIVTETGTIIALEAPHRLQAALSDIRQVLGDRRISICRELTKVYEETFRGTVSGAIRHFTAPRGEFTLVIAGAAVARGPELTGDIARRLQRMYLSGIAAREAVAAVAGETGLKKKALYQAWLGLDRSCKNKRSHKTSKGDNKCAAAVYL
jgi:16S rRNA (cytidine1402-2'-O)-methyltransferase